MSIHTQYPEGLEIEKGSVQTLGNTYTTIWSRNFASLSDRIVKIQADVLGLEDGGGNSASFEKIGIFKNVSGSITQIEIFILTKKKVIN